MSREERVRFAIALIAILALALVLRVASAGGFWIDEVFSAANAKAGPSTFLDRSRGEPHSPWPIYYLILSGWQIAFPTVAGMKALSVVLSLAGVLALGGVGWSLGGRRTALLAALLAAANPLLAWYGGEIRMYALMLLLLTGALGAAIRAMACRRARAGLVFALLAALAVYAHVFAAFPVLVMTVAVVVRAGRRAAAAAVALGVLAAAPAAAMVAAQAGHWLGWKGDVAGSAYVSSPLNLVAAVQSFFTAYALPLGGFGAARGAALLAVAIVVGWPLAAALRGRPVAARLLVALVIVGLVGPWLVQMRTRMFAPRFALTALPPLLLLVATGLAGMRRRAATGLAALLVLGGIAAVAGRAGRTDWREVSDVLRRERTPGSSFAFQGGNVIALEEWFGDHFRPSETFVLDGRAEAWEVRTTPPAEVVPPAPYSRTVRRFRPERRLVEDENPWIVRWSLP